MRLGQTQSKVQNDAEFSCEQSATADLSSLNSNLQKHAQQKDSGELKLKDSPGVGYPTLGRPWVAQGPGAFLLVGGDLRFCSAGRGPRASSAKCRVEISSKAGKADDQSDNYRLLEPLNHDIPTSTPTHLTTFPPSPHITTARPACPAITPI